MAAFSPGSEVVLTFKQPLENESETSWDSALKLAQRVASLGEPYVSFFTPEAIEEKLLNAGFTEVQFLSPVEADTRYFKQRKDIPTPRNTTIVSANRG
jgi:O-methyltransferase involved in polyketide biosynthesis